MTLEILTSESLPGIHHGFFTRRGGASSGVFSGLNCGLGSSDQSEVVALNRTRVAEAMRLKPEAMVGVHQIHSAEVVTITEATHERPKPTRWSPPPLALLCRF